MKFIFLPMRKHGQFGMPSWQLTQAVMRKLAWSLCCAGVAHRAAGRDEVVDQSGPRTWQDGMQRDGIQWL
jgi:hypothetical protein